MKGCKSCPNQSFEVDEIKDDGRKVMHCISCGERHVEASEIAVGDSTVEKRDVYQNHRGNDRAVIQILVEPEKEISVAPVPNPMGRSSVYSFEEFKEEFL